MSCQLTFAKGAARLGRWGELRVVDHAHLAIWRNECIEEFDASLGWPPHLGTCGWVFEETGICLVTWNDAERLLVVNMAVPEVEREVTFDRDPERRMRVLCFRPAGLARVVFLWEGGVGCLGDRGELIWQAMHEDGTAMFDEITDDEVWIKRQSGDQSRDRRRGYRLADGAVIG